MQPLLARALVYQSVQESQQLWIQIPKAPPNGDYNAIKSLVDNIFANRSDWDKKNITEYLCSKNLQKLFPKLQCGQMLKTDAKLIRESQKLKAVRESLASVDGRL